MPTLRHAVTHIVSPISQYSMIKSFEYRHTRDLVTRITHIAIEPLTRAHLHIKGLTYLIA